MIQLLAPHWVHERTKSPGSFNLDPRSLVHATRQMRSAPPDETITKNQNTKAEESGPYTTQILPSPPNRKSDWRFAIKEMAEHAATVMKIPAEEIDNAVWQREQIMHTGLPFGLAVPHARLAGLEKPVVILGRSPKGVDFDAPDGEKAKIILMLLTPRNDATAQIELLGLVAQVFNDSETRQRVRASNTATEMIAAISLAESHLGEHGSSPRIPEEQV